MLLPAIKRTLHSFTKGYFILLLIKSALLSLCVFGLFLFAIQWLLSYTSFVSTGWIETILDWVVGVGSVFLSWLLLPALVPFIASLFKELIAKRIEAKEYPDSPASHESNLSEEICYELGFMFWLIFLNILCLPLYFIPVVNLFVYYTLNGYFIGREFFEMAASRHLGKREAKRLRKELRYTILFGGIMIVFLINIPFVNIVMPFIAIALMVHLYHRIALTS